MSVMFPKYFGVPHAVIRLGFWAQMSPKEQSLYTVLMHDSERYRTRELVRADADISQFAGISPRALCDARKKLQERGLVICERGKANVYRYILCDPETGRPWPGAPKEIVRYRKKDDSGGGISASIPPVPSKRWSDQQQHTVQSEDSLEIHGLPGLFKS